MKKYVWIALAVALVVISSGVYVTYGSAEIPVGSTATADLISGAPQTVPIPGMVTMVDLGAHRCIPCKMMTPIIEELSAEYEGRAAIVFMDVWENDGIAEQFGLSAIPTQIFYDIDGKEQFRHEGFLDKKAIVKILQGLGVS